MKVVAVCSGNICRSAIAEQALRAALRDFAPVQDGRLVFASAGTIAQTGQAMPDEAARISREFGGDPDEHGATFLSEMLVKDATLVLAMAREHRAAVLKMAPSLMRRTFTLREFDRLSRSVGEDRLVTSMHEPLVGASPEARLRAALGALADARGLAPAPERAEDDDVIDPYLRDEQTYRLAAEQLQPGIAAVRSVLTLPAMWQD